MKKKALFISGGWEGHEPIETSEYISKQITKFEIESQIVNDLEVMSDLNYLKSFDVILPVWTMGKIDDDNWEIKNSKVEKFTGSNSFWCWACGLARRLV